MFLRHVSCASRIDNMVDLQLYMQVQDAYFPLTDHDLHDQPLNDQKRTITDWSLHRHAVIAAGPRLLPCLLMAWGQEK